MNLETLFTVELENAREVVREKERQLEQLRDRPAGCVCDPRAWADSDSIDAVCEEFAPMDEDPTLCTHCDHLKECHGKDNPQ